MNNEENNWMQLLSEIGSESNNPSHKAYEIYQPLFVSNLEEYNYENQAEENLKSDAALETIYENPCFSQKIDSVNSELSLVNHNAENNKIGEKFYNIK